MVRDRNYFADDPLIRLVKEMLEFTEDNIEPEDDISSFISGGTKPKPDNTFGQLPDPIQKNSATNSTDIDCDQISIKLHNARITAGNILEGRKDSFRERCIDSLPDVLKMLDAGIEKLNGYGDVLFDCGKSEADNNKIFKALDEDIPNDLKFYDNEALRIANKGCCTSTAIFAKDLEQEFEIARRSRVAEFKGHWDTQIAIDKETREMLSDPLTAGLDIPPEGTPISVFGIVDDQEPELERFIHGLIAREYGNNLSFYNSASAKCPKTTGEFLDEFLKSMSDFERLLNENIEGEIIRLRTGTRDILEIVANEHDEAERDRQIVERSQIMALLGLAVVAAIVGVAFWYVSIPAALAAGGAAAAQAVGRTAVTYGFRTLASTGVLSEVIHFVIGDDINKRLKDAEKQLQAYREIQERMNQGRATFFGQADFERMVEEIDTSIRDKVDAILSLPEEEQEDAWIALESYSKNLGKQIFMRELRNNQEFIEWVNTIADEVISGIEGAELTPAEVDLGPGIERDDSLFDLGGDKNDPIIFDFQQLEENQELPNGGQRSQFGRTGLSTFDTKFPIALESVDCIGEQCGAFPQLRYRVRVIQPGRSLNNYEYSPQMLQHSARLLEGVPVQAYGFGQYQPMFSHLPADLEPMQPSGFALNRVGVLKEPAYKSHPDFGEGLFATLVVDKAAEGWAKTILDEATTPGGNGTGVSIFADIDGDYGYDDFSDEMYVKVNAIKSFRSVDLASQPAAGGAIVAAMEDAGWEQREYLEQLKEEIQKLTIEEIIEARRGDHRR